MVTLMYLKSMALSELNVRLVQGAVALNSVWAFVSFFCVAFQCKGPRYWEVATGKCHNQVSLLQSQAFSLLIFC